MELFSVKEVCKRTGLSRKQLFDYQSIVGPTDYDKSGYKLYDSEAIEKLKDVALYRSIDLPLKVIDKIINKPGFERNQAIRKHISYLINERENVDEKIKIAKSILK